MSNPWIQPNSLDWIGSRDGLCWAKFFLTHHDKFGWKTPLTRPKHTLDFETWKTHLINAKFSSFLRGAYGSTNPRIIYLQVWNNSNIRATKKNKISSINKWLSFINNLITKGWGGERILDDSSLYRTTQTGHCKKNYLFIFI